MQKPRNYDSTVAAGDYVPVEPGGHKMIIKEVKETKSKNGKDMIVVFFDFAQEDRQPNYFSEQYKNDTRDEKKWSFQGTKYILSEDSNGDCNRDFKGFITSVEKSNQGFSVEWGANFPFQFKGKKVGGVFGVVESEYEGKVRKRTELRWFTQYDKADESAVPKEKLLNKNNNNSTQSDGFMNIPDAIDEEQPFR